MANLRNSCSHQKVGVLCFSTFSLKGRISACINCTHLMHKLCNLFSLYSVYMLQIFEFFGGFICFLFILSHYGRCVTIIGSFIDLRTCASL
jgi:hypothetical protein